MATRFTRNWHRGQWLFFSLLLGCSLGFGGVPQRAIADVVIKDDQPTPSEIDKPGQETSEPKVLIPESQGEPENSAAHLLPLTPSSNDPATSNLSAPASENEQVPVATSIIPDPSLYKPTLPPIGDAPAYLPDATNPLGLYLVVKLGDRRVYVHQRDKIVASYPIAVGKPGWETPRGEYKVFNMEKNPIFKSFKSGHIIKPGPDNPLGVRWIGIWTDGKTQLGFHGTNQPELIGQAVSHGCIRMLNKDVTSLFGQVAIGTPVKVEP